MRLSLLAIFLFIVLHCSGQAYREGDVIDDFNAANMLNNKSKTGSFYSYKKDITIIDFFGTWCAPCVKALPVLDSIQKRYPSQVSILLVSIEKEAQLNKFIAARKKFSFPVIVDEGNAITNLFRPPSYPYTVIVDRNNSIVSITEASAITDEKIKEWLAQKSIPQKKVAIKNIPLTENKKSTMPPVNEYPVAALSADFIYAAKTGDETTAIEKKLQDLSFDELKDGLKSDEEKKAFWINIYNGYTQLLLRKNPGKYKKRNKFFKAKQIAIAGKMFSLDEIEHDILRRSKIKWSLGYLNKLFSTKIEKQLRVEQLDYRIHFALNCGAKSCPPIAFYAPADLQSQLDIAAKAYLTSEASYNKEKNTLQLPAIMGWFRRDFKGKKNMLLLVKKSGVVPGDKKPSISFKKYNWNLYLNNYKN